MLILLLMFTFLSTFLTLGLRYFASGDARPFLSKKILATSVNRGDVGEMQLSHVAFINNLKGIVDSFGYDVYLH